MTKEQISKKLDRKLTRQELFLYELMSKKENYKIEFKNSSFIYRLIE